MQMVMRAIVYLLVTLLAVILFAPKKELYYLFERELANQHIVLANEAVHETPFGLELEHVKIRVDGAEVAEIQQVRLWSLFFYTKATFDGVKPAPGMERLLPVQIERGEASYSVLDPSRLHLRLQGTFGTAQGSLHLFPPRTLYMELLKPGDLGSLRPYLKKVKGRWIYETRL